MQTTFLKYITLLLLFTFGLYTYANGRERHNFTLVIDPGHGGHDSGAVGAFSKEKDINLKVSLAFGRLVEENCPDVKVVYTRSKDIFIPLQRRADIANQNKADLFISIHTNALAKGRLAYGAETYTLGMARANSNLEVARRENSVMTLESDYKSKYEGFDPNKAESYVIFEFMQDRNMKQSVELARNIQRQYTSAGRPDKGVHQAGFWVLHSTSMPSVLTEIGFITTPAEEQYLNSERGQAEVSRSIYNGFLAYRRSYDKKADDLPQNLPARVEQTESREQIDKKQSQVVAVVPIETKTTAQIIGTAGTENRKQSSKNDAVCKKINTREPKTEQPSATVNRAQQPVRSADKPHHKQVAEVKQPREQKATPDKNNLKGEKQRTKTEANNNHRQQAQQPATVKNKVTYHIQVGAGKKQIAPNDPQFKGLNIKRVKEGTLYKYHYGNYSTHAEARKALRTVQAKMPEAYIVAYISGKPTSVSEAREQEKK